MTLGVTHTEGSKGKDDQSKFRLSAVQQLQPNAGGEKRGREERERKDAGRGGRKGVRE